MKNSEDEKYIEELIRIHKKNARDLDYGYHRLTCSNCNEEYEYIVMDITDYGTKRVRPHKNKDRSNVIEGYDYKPMGDTRRFCSKHYTEWRKSPDPERIKEIRSNYFL